MTRLISTLLTSTAICVALLSALAFAQDRKVDDPPRPPAPAPAKAPLDQMKKVASEVLLKGFVQVEAAKPAAAKAAVQPKAAIGKVEVQQKAAVAKRAAGVAKGGAVRFMGAVDLDGQIQQFVVQFRPILGAEYHVVRVVCQLTLEERKTIAREAERALKDVARKYAEGMRRPMNMNDRAALEPRKMIQDGLLHTAKAHLQAAQVARYEEELSRRRAGRKQLAVRNLVARLDRDMVLTALQRDQIARSLSSHWDDSWGQSLEMFMHDYNFFPPIPDQHVAPFLKDPQKKIWRSTQRSQVFFGGFGMIGGVMAEDPLEDDDLREARLIAETTEKQGEGSKEDIQTRIDQIKRFRGEPEKIELQRKFQELMAPVGAQAKAKPPPKK
jgi:hypothetical protein